MGGGETAGAAPLARRCAAVCVVGVDALLVHGGEDPAHPHRPPGDAHVLDLETMAWRGDMFGRIRIERRRNQPRNVSSERVQTTDARRQVGARRVRVERRLRDRVRRRRRVRPVPRGPVALKRRDRDVDGPDAFGTGSQTRPTGGSRGRGRRRPVLVHRGGRKRSERWRPRVRRAGPGRDGVVRIGSRREGIGDAEDGVEGEFNDGTNRV